MISDGTSAEQPSFLSARPEDLISVFFELLCLCG